MTVRAVRLLASADVILHDDLVPSAILEAAPGNAEIVNVGKRCGVKTITQAQINALMIDSARKNLSVIRLKSGDPLVFGRAAEEMDALRRASIPFEIVPGVTSGFAAAAALQVSLTDRRSSSGIHISTAHHAPGADHTSAKTDWSATQIIYMPGRSLDALAAEWLVEGADPALPCVIVSRAAQPDQHIQHTTLEKLHEADAAASPSLLLAGWALAISKHD
jgi:uroporphyrin-III C-methyltransferase